MLTEESARRCLAREWNLPRATLTRLDGGMGSRTWTVDDTGRRWVLKAVAPALGEDLAGGLAVARVLGAAGIPAGTPAPTRAGALTAGSGEYRLGLLTPRPGRSGSTRRTAGAGSSTGARPCAARCSTTWPRR